MKILGRGISKGHTSGKVKKVSRPVSFLGDVDPEKGVVFGEKNISDSIFVFPGGRGSTVGSYVIYQLKENGYAPKGMINSKTETIVASGAIISDIPLVDMIDIDLLQDGDYIELDGNDGIIELPEIEEKEVVTAFIQKDDRILLFRRSEEVGTYQGKWAGVSGYLEDNEPLEQAEIEIKEETGLEPELVKEGKPVLARDGDKIWKVHPFLFSAEEEPTLNWENEKYEWVAPSKMKKKKTVPNLYEAYQSLRC